MGDSANSLVLYKSGIMNGGARWRRTVAHRGARWRTVADGGARWRRRVANGGGTRIVAIAHYNAKCRLLDASKVAGRQQNQT